MGRKTRWGLGVLSGLVVLGGLAFWFRAPLFEAVFLAPRHGFEASAAPGAPDYATDAAWLVLPSRPGNAALAPDRVAAPDVQATAPVDVFFITPTTYYSKDGWNARYDEGGDTENRLVNGVVRFQVTEFNGCCRIYAPRYRQATLYSFMGKGESEHAALDLAYQDVLRAFDEFIATRSQGRPFIVAGHSQGSLHGMRLLQERIAGTPLAQRLVAAYLVGYAIPRDMQLPGGLGPCRNATDTGCYLTWNSLSASAERHNWQQTSTIWLDKRYQMIAGRPLDCMNPLSWQIDDTAAADANLGGLGFVRDGEPLGRTRPGLTGAACTEGVLVVAPPDDNPGLTFGVFNGSYHIYDYNLFYMNIRQNLADRVAAYLQATPSEAQTAVTKAP